MLVLTRRVGESIAITDSNNNVLAQIVVANINKNQVKIGIDTSVDYKILRNELYEHFLQEER